MYLRYAFCTVLQLLFTAVAYVLAPLVALFTRSTGYLPTWLAWFQTEDAPLDAGWKDGYFTTSGTPTGILLWWLRVRWLWRNPAYGFCYWPMGIAYVPSDWTITTLELDASGTLTAFEATTKDGKYFSKTSSNGAKYGFKLWWGLNATNTALIDVLPDSRGPDNRLPICFTPALPWKD